jgi:hypothetical protein
MGIGINYLIIKELFAKMFAMYTPQTANKILPEVRRLFNEISSERNHVVRLQEELQMSVESGSPFQTVMTKKQELNAAVANLYKHIQQLEDLGVMIKSVDEGLLDFPAMRFNEEVWLCWKAGEPEVKFWHHKDEGFNGRKPLGTDGFEDDLAKLV